MTDRRTLVRGIVVSQLEALTHPGGYDGDLDDSTDILGSGVIDSLAFVDILIGVESQLGAQLALDRLDFEQIGSLGALVDALHELLEES